MTLKQLEAFYWAATLGSFVRAAAHLHVTQSSLSKRISELEDDLSKRLFNRVGPRTVITEAGGRLLEYATRMLDAEQMARRALDAEGQLKGVCKFGVTELVASTWLPQLVREVRSRHPDLVLEPHVELTRGLQHRLERGEIDFAVLPASPRNPDLERIPIAKLSYAWMASPSRLPDGTRLTAEHFKDHPVAMLSPDSTLTQSLENWALSQDLHIPKALVCNSLLALIGVTVAGVAIGIFPEIYMRALLKAGSLVKLDCAVPLPELEYTFCWRRGDHRRVIEQARSMVQQTADFCAPVLIPGTGQ